jgi:DNA-binding transcriptional ArsR family regulator
VAGLPHSAAMATRWRTQSPDGISTLTSLKATALPQAIRLRGRTMKRCARLYVLTRIFPMEYIKCVESVFEVVAEPNRRAILSLLALSQQSVGEIERQLHMPQPAVSKHLRVLREAGFVESMVDAQRRLYRLRPGPFQELEAWLEQFRRFWLAHVDALERHLDRINPPAASNRTTRRKRRTPDREREKGETK